MTKELTIQNIEAEVLDSNKPAVVKFSSENCHLCVALEPVTERLHTKYKDKFNFYNVNTTEQEKLTEIFSDDGVPTIYIFKDGDAVEIPYPERPDEKTGYSEEYLDEYLNNH